MFPRKSSSAKLLCALAALLALVACNTKKEPGVLTQPQVAELLRKWDAAQMNSDLDGVVACLSKSLRHKYTFKGFGPTDTMAGGYREYIEATKRGFGAAQTISGNRTMGTIAVNPDGQSASVLSEVHYAMNVEGELFRTVSSGTMTVGLEDGRAVITSIDQVVTPDSEGRQPFQSARD